MKKNLIFNYKYFIPFFILILFAFITRYFAHLQFDAMEDEILSIDFNTSYSWRILLKAPDPSHPPLWYLLMEFPTKIFAINNGILPYRLIQIFTFFILLLISVILMIKNKISTVFLLVFLTLILSNVHLTHLSIEHRMYALTIGLGIFYSFFWYLIIKKNIQLSKKYFVYLLIITYIFFFTTYSSVWIIIIWPTVYLFQNFNLKTVQKILLFFVIFFSTISWFLPTLFNNFKNSVVDNQWAPVVNFSNTIELIGQYFGLLSVNGNGFNKVLNPIVIPFILLFAIIIIYYFKNKKDNLSKYLFVSILISFLLFVLISFFTGKRLFYSRTSITIVFVIYILLAGIYVKGDKLLKIGISILIILQLSQFLIYFFLLETKLPYSVFNYPIHPVSKFQKYNFNFTDCLISLPRWNYLSSQYYLGDLVKVIEIDDFFSDEIDNCNEIFLLDQTSVDRSAIAKDLSLIKQKGFVLDVVLTYDNQALYQLNKIE